MAFFSKPTSLVILLVFLFSPLKSNAEVSDWKTIGWWDISFYSESRGCSAYVAFDGGIQFFIGLGGIGSELMLDILLLNKKWTSIETAKEYEVEVKFGNEGPWTLDMSGINSGEYPGLEISVLAASDKGRRFVNEFMRELNMDWTYDGNSLGLLSLKTSRIAFGEVVACTKSYRNAVKDSSDPFATGVKLRDEDPFN